MKVKRIVYNIATATPSEAESFYSAIFGLDVVMDHGWIRTYSSSEKMTTQLSVASQGGSGTPVPDLSIEVDCLETALERVKNANIKIEYGPASEPWGVRRFYVRDPFGKLVNVLQHVDYKAV
ncbi:VOC family protein [Halopseudomonas phragmitis]|uniref:Glyoxalase n=1 Tax=Halopseudomonas phragmitis TaxID=1931241 RepID=A0A1V0B8E2_9GAMM|nr:VOC family protein [Halopseudomonas phragmitis]AQZ96177.1 glyoxalase [Halopseudomonas phragmitis]